VTVSAPNPRRRSGRLRTPLNANPVRRRERLRATRYRDRFQPDSGRTVKDAALFGEKDRSASMWNRGFFFVALIVVASLLGTAHAQEGQWVNVKAQWCGNTCGEGHDDAACLCEYNKGQSPSSPYSWNTCHGAPCCAWATVFCSVGDPDCSCVLEDGTNPERMRQWCFPDAPIVNCRAPYISGAYSCSYDCTYESECQINYPTSNPN